MKDTILAGSAIETSDGTAGKTSRPGRQLLASSATVSIFNGLGVLAGFALDATIAALFGVGTQTDAFFSAWRLPYLGTVVLNMAVGATLVPLFSRAVAARDESTLSEFFSRVFNAIVLGMAVLAGLGVLLSPWLIPALFAGLPPASRALAASLSRILFLTWILSGAVEVLRAFLYGHQLFALPTAINFVRSATVIAVVLVGRSVLAKQMESDWVGLHLLAWGFVLGYCAQLMTVGWQAWRRTPLRWQPLLDPRHPRLQEAMRLARAPTAGALVRQSINLAETVIASYLPPGSVTVLSYANRLTFVVSSVFLSSVTTASMPMLSRTIGERQWREVRQTLASALRLVVFLALPLGVGLAALGVPVIRLLFERGRFSPEASRLTGTVLSFYALSILFLGYFRVVQAYFYAALKASVVLVLFVILAVSAIGLDWWLAGRIGVQGIAMGFTVGTGLATALGLWLLGRHVAGQHVPGPTSPAAAAQAEVRSDGEGQRVLTTRGGTRIGSIDPAATLRSLLLLNVRIGLASLLMAATAQGMLRLLPNVPWALLPALIVGVVLFMVSAWLLRVDELWTAWEWVNNKWVRDKGQISE